MTDINQLEQVLGCLRSMTDGEIDRISAIVADSLLQSALNDTGDATKDRFIATILTIIVERSQPSVNCYLTSLRNILHRPSMIDCHQVQTLIDTIEQGSDGVTLLTSLQGIYNEAKFTISVDTINIA